MSSRAKHPQSIINAGLVVLLCGLGALAISRANTVPPAEQLTIATGSIEWIEAAGEPTPNPPYRSQADRRAMNPRFILRGIDKIFTYQMMSGRSLTVRKALESAPPKATVEVRYHEASKKESRRYTNFVFSVYSVVIDGEVIRTRDQIVAYRSVKATIWRVGGIAVIVFAVGMIVYGNVLIRWRERYSES
ncbi:MAG: hypothetical protein AAAFM81_03430 [Pseudomonadota bacterium]